jgi:hypothetical protein
VTKKATQVEVEDLFSKHSMKVLGRYVNSQTPLKSECLICGNLITPRLDKVRLRGHQCGYCAGRSGTDKKALEIVKKIGHKPLEPYPGALQPWRMKCGGCGKVISPKFNSLQQGRWGCKFCGHSKAGAKRRELSSNFAIQMMRDAGYEPLEPYPGSNLPWKSRCLKCDALVQPRLGGIKSGQGGCRKCGIASSARSRMYTAEQAEKIALKKGLRPLEPYRGSTYKWNCECLRCGKCSSPRFQAIRDGKYGCLWCAKKIVNPADARKKMLAAKLKPLTSYPGSDKGWLCECMKCKREVTPTYGSIRAGQGGCKWCKKVAPKIDPMFATQFFLQNQIQPLEPFKNSHANWKSRCLRCDNQINPRYHDIKQGGGGCKYCAPNFVNLSKILKVMKAASLIPQEKYPGSKADWKVLHKTCGRIFKVQYQNLRKGGSCRYCAGKAVIPKEAVDAMKKSGFKPLTPYTGAKNPWKCRCLICNRIVYPTYGSILWRGGGCAYCTGSKVDVKDAKKLMQLNDLEPLEPFPGAAKKWKCKCKVCKRTVSPRYTSIQSGQGGCRYCAAWGIDYGANGYLYLMTHKEFSSHKLGIGNSIRSRGRSRIEQHEKHGWKLYKRLDFEITDVAFQVEQEVLAWLREAKALPAYLSEFEMPQGGYSETVNADEIDLPTIWAKVEELNKVKR